MINSGSAKRFFVGLISGTSVDGIDAGVFAFEGSLHHPKISLVSRHSHAYPAKFREQIISLSSPGDNEIDRLGELDIGIGSCFAEAALKAIENAALKPSDICAIGSHGQTIRHRPAVPSPFTLQVGDPNVIAENTGITCVADVRRRDMAAGGQGAPLAPAFHHAAFFNPNEERCIVNIGGISNISFLSSEAGDVYGYDTGPGNLLMDAWVQHFTGEKYDENGKLAASGRVNETLLSELMQHPFLSQRPPKSTGREDFNADWLAGVLKNFDNLSPENVQATLADFTAQSIASEILSRKVSRVSLCGGGAHNKTLINRIRHFLPNHVVDTTETLGIHPDWVEAGLLAWIAKQTIDGLPANFPSVTGAKKAVKLGAIYPA